VLRPAEASVTTMYNSLLLCPGALDFKQYIGGIYLAGVLVEVQAARKLAAIYTLTQAA